MNKMDQRKTRVETAVEKNLEDLLVKIVRPKNYVNQLGKRVRKVYVVSGRDYIKVYPIGWLEKQTWREINDILRLNGFSWFSDGRHSCWIKEVTKIEMQDL